MKIRSVLQWFGVCILIGATNLFGDETNRAEQVRQMVAELKWNTGSVVLGNGIARLNLPPNFRYLGPEDTRKVLVDIWKNPPNRGDTLGMIFPADMSPVTRDSWAVVITYREDGYVKDDDAAKVDYDQLLAQMKKEVAAENEQRAKNNFSSIELIGWAVPPRYDRDTHKLLWAKELSFASDPVHTLNYDIRVLGRKGMISVNAVASMEQLAQVEEQMPAIMSMINFTDGNRYTDYQQGNDKVAEYGLAALILGGVAAKAGLLKGLFALLAASWKFIAIAVVAAGGFIARSFRKLSGKAVSKQ